MHHSAQSSAVDCYHSAQSSAVVLTNGYPWLPTIIYVLGCAMLCYAMVSYTCERQEGMQNAPVMITSEVRVTLGCCCCCCWCCWDQDMFSKQKCFIKRCLNDVQKQSRMCANHRMRSFGTPDSRKSSDESEKEASWDGRTEAHTKNEAS